MAASAPHEADAPPPSPPRHIAPMAWGALAVALIATAAWLGTRNVDGRMGAELPPAKTVAAKPPPWNLAVDGIVVGSKPAVVQQRKGFQDAEERVIEIYQTLRNGRRAQALTLAESLATDLPNFQLGRLLYADLLSVSTNQPIDLKSLTSASSDASSNFKSLIEESRLRLKALTEVPAPGTLPDNLLTLPDSTRHVIAVDTSRSRLYWLINQAKPGKPLDLVLQKDLYISVGRNGVEKQIEGDGRTPLGVYTITSKLNDEALPDLYGRGALPLNYPNALDILRGKTGSGIWLHGTPSEQYVRAPLASDGCVVLSNPDIASIFGEPGIVGTSVVISPELNWVKRDAIPDLGATFRARFDEWLANRRGGDLAKLRDTYSDDFFRKGKKLAHWWPTIKGEAVSTIKISDLSMVKWADQKDEVVVVNFAEQLKPRARVARKRQYWRLEQGEWKIFYEGNA